MRKVVTGVIKTTYNKRQALQLFYTLPFLGLCGNSMWLLVDVVITQGTLTRKEGHMGYTELYAARHRKRLTRKQVAQAVGISVHMLKHYEMRENEPTRETMEKLAEYYGQPLERLARDIRIRG